jgi:putative spermidine/putrescine transport system permease protein
MRFLYGATIGSLILFILTPIVVVVVVSFGAGQVMEFPPTKWSLHWYAYALSQPAFVNSAINSAFVAALATAIALPISLSAAIGIVRHDFPGKTILQAVLLAPLFVPAVVTSLALLLALSRIEIRVASTRLVAAHVLIVLPYLIRTIVASLTRLDVNLEDAARTLGASQFRVLLHITLPLIRAGLIAGVLFALIISFDNVSVSLFLTTPRTNTLPIAILNYVEYNFDPSIAAISTMLIAVTAAVALFMERTVGLRSVAKGG